MYTLKDEIELSSLGYNTERWTKCNNFIAVGGAGLANISIWEPSRKSVLKQATSCWDYVR